MKAVFMIIALTVAMHCYGADGEGDSLRFTVDSLHLAGDRERTLRDSLFMPLPDMMLDEVVVTAPRLDRIGVPLRIDPVEAQLMQGQPAGFNPLALVGWIVSKIVGHRHKMTQRERWKQAIDNY